MSIICNGTTLTNVICNGTFCNYVLARDTPEPAIPIQVNNVFAYNWKYVFAKYNDVNEIGFSNILVYPSLQQAIIIFPLNSWGVTNKECLHLILVGNIKDCLGSPYTDFNDIYYCDIVIDSSGNFIYGPMKTINKHFTVSSCNVSTTADSYYGSVIQVTINFSYPIFVNGNNFISGAMGQCAFFTRRYL